MAHCMALSHVDELLYAVAAFAAAALSLEALVKWIPKELC